MAKTLTKSWQDLGTGSFSGLTGCGVKLQGKYTSQDAAGTNVALRVVTSGSGYWRTTNGTAKFTGQYTNSASLATYPNYVYSGTTILSKTGYIEHNADGTKTISIGSTGSITTSSGTSSYSISNVSVILPKINRRSIGTLDKPTFNIGETINVTITQYIDSYHQDLYMKIGDAELLIQSSASKDTPIEVETSLLANTLYQASPNSSSYSSVFKIYTYDSNNQQIGSAYEINYTANIVGLEPSFDVSYADSNSTTAGITSNNQYLIQNKSTLQITAINMAKSSYAGSLTSISVTINGQTTTESLTTETSKVINCGVVNADADVVATIVLTDSRGLTKTKTLTIHMLAWSLPSAVISLARQYNYYTETDITADGRYSPLTINGTNKNSMTLQYRIKKVSDATYGSWNSLVDNQQTTFNADNAYDWNVQVQVSDLLDSQIYTEELRVGLPKLFVDNLRMAIGMFKFPDHDNCLDVDGNIYSNGINVLNPPKARYIWNGYEGTQQSSTTAANVTNFSTTLTTYGGDLFVSVSAPFYQSNGTGNMRVYVDNVEKATIIRTNSKSNVQVHGEAIITGISAGSHAFRVTMQPQNSSYTCYIGTYIEKVFTIIEL